MNIVSEIKETYKSIPNPVKSFLKRALLVFIIWKLIYHIFLFNGRIIDAPLTHLTSYSTGRVLSWIYPGNQFAIHEDCRSLPENDYTLYCYDDITINNKKAVGIADGCNGLELYILYIGFLLCISTSVKKTANYIWAGALLIYLINIGRCVAIAILNIHQNKLTDVAHHYIFKLIVYAFIFLLWFLYLYKRDDE